MIVGEPVKNGDTNDTEIDLFKVTRDEIKWMRQAVWHHQNDIDEDDYKQVNVGKDVLEKLQEAINKMRPPE